MYNLKQVEMLSGNKKWAYVIILALIWGSSFILIKKSLIGLTPLQLGALRTLISGFFIFIIGFKTIKTITRIQWKWLIISGFLGSFFPAFFFAYAETEIDSAVASILNSLIPLNTVLLGLAIFKIASTRRQIFGVILGFVGTALLILKGAELNPEQDYMYAGFVILSTIMYAANVNIIKKYLQEVSPITITVGNFAAIIIPAFVVLLFTNFFSNATFNNPNFIMSMVYVIILSVFGTALAKVLFNRLIQISTAVFASSVAYLMAVVAVVWGVLDGEKFSFLQAIATVFILIGVYLSSEKTKKPSVN